MLCYGFFVFFCPRTLLTSLFLLQQMYAQPIQYAPTMVQAINNPDGTVSIIGIDPSSHGLVTLPDGTQAQVRTLSAVRVGTYRLRAQLFILCYRFRDQAMARLSRPWQTFQAKTIESHKSEPLTWTWVEERVLRSQHWPKQQSVLTVRSFLPAKMGLRAVSFERIIL